MKNAPFFPCSAIAGLSLVISLSVSSVDAQTVIADSVAEFSVTQGQDDWNYGYRNLTADGGVRVTYDPVADFVPFDPGANDGAKWDLGAGAPWTEVGPTAVHPNGTNNAQEHWATRRWTATSPDITQPTLVQVEWTVRKTNLNGGNAAGGVTGRLHLDGETKGVAAIAANDGVGVTTSTFLTVDVGSILDLACTPVGADGSTGDGSDGSETIMTVTTVVDTDTDLLADAWEAIYFPGPPVDLTQLESGMDYDNDGLNDEDEQTAGSDPTVSDTDNDGLTDDVEVLTHGSNPTLADTDGDGISDFDEVNGTIPTDPTLVDTDEDGFSDSDELLFGTNPVDPGDTPLTDLLANSVTQFSGVDGQDGWSWGYRNYTVDGGGTDYDAGADFIPFPVDGTNTRSDVNFWNGTNYDWFNGNPPWTFLAAESTHPNGTNNAEEHWTVRRWTAGGLGTETPVRVTWHARKTNGNGDGVTGGVHLNGAQVDAATIAGNNTAGVIRFYYLNILDGDMVDQILSPQGVTNRSDGSDGSANWMRIDERIPAVPQQPDGRYFIPVNAVDSEPDGLADFWEEVYFPGDLTQLFSGNDFDSDGALDEEEQAASTDPTEPDTDGDGRTDGDELHVAPLTDPYVFDTDGDGFSDGHETSTGHDPTDPNDNARTTGIADSVVDFPAQDEPNPQGQNGWNYGYYNTTADGVPPANSGLIPFPTDGTIAPSDVNHWNGTNFDWFDATGAAQNPPWTSITRTGGHPNGDNNGDVHWAVRRWTASIAEPQALALNYHISKGGGGNGTTAVILQNGEPVDSRTVAPGGSITTWYFVYANPGDTIDIALTPEGTDGSNADGNDSSNFWLVVDTVIPADPKQPDGTPFVIAPFELKILEISYDDIFGETTLKWTTQSGKEYQIQTSPDLVTWTNAGPTYASGSGGEREETVSAGAPPMYLRVQEVDP